MKNSRVHFSWNRDEHLRFRTGVSLHSHTLHSHETLDFVYRSIDQTPFLNRIVKRQLELYHQNTGRELVLTDAWWTPRLSPYCAWKLEASQIEERLGMASLVSLSDHDDIQAGAQMRLLNPPSDFPISVEWTVPYRESFFHLGIHNLPPFAAPTIMQALAAFTHEPVELQIPGILEWLATMPGTLIVFYHPCWDEKSVGAGLYECLVKRFIGAHRRWIHALELNGFRPWHENQRVISLAGAVGLPFISGGDRHGLEPNACLNVTGAATFPEFADEIRKDGRSEVVFMSQYRQPLGLRVLENIFQVLQDDPEHSLGWTHWSDRVFYRDREGVARSVGALWGDRPPSAVHQFARLSRVIGNAWPIFKLACQGGLYFGSPFRSRDRANAYN